MAEIVSFASGKGGVGKTLLTAALGIFLSRKGKKVLLIDGDMGMRNMLLSCDGSGGRPLLCEGCHPGSE